jgi:hypothetical protein
LRISKCICEMFLCHRIAEYTLLPNTHTLTWHLKFKNILPFYVTRMKCNFMYGHRKDTAFIEPIFKKLEVFNKNMCRGVIQNVGFSCTGFHEILNHSINLGIQRLH